MEMEQRGEAIAQVLTPIYEEQFHDHSYGFRPNRCAQQAIITALDMMNDGYDWIVDIDLEKFFDTVNHDKLIWINTSATDYVCAYGNSGKLHIIGKRIL
jgi:retron-type reverse transcriptase